MNDDAIKAISEFLDNEIKYHLFNYYYIKMMHDTSDEEYVYKLECL